jgi:polygalacturonase
MKKLRILTLWLVALGSLAAGPIFAAAKTFNVLDYGAKGDGAALDTAAIQRTIDAAAAAGGQVLIPRQHTFLIATLDLKGGIDPDHCRNVEIKNCQLTCGGDAIVIKATRQTNDFGACANIRVHDCVIRTQDAGLKIGTETTSDIHDVLF